MPRSLTAVALYASVASPLGELLLLGHSAVLCGLYMQAGERPVALRADWTHEPNAFPEVRSQLAQYFAGSRTSFDLSLDARGTPFERRVWQALQEIPYGQTMTYAELARDIGRPTAARAVGAANGANPISIIIPCHRLIGANGTLTGYAGGLERKRSLLDLEAGIGASRRRV